jgi:hypothetical protein
MRSDDDNAWRRLGTLLYRETESRFSAVGYSAALSVASIQRGTVVLLLNDELKGVLIFVSYLTAISVLSL